VKADFGNADSFLKLNGNTSISIYDIKKDPASNIRSGVYQVILILDDKHFRIPYSIELFVNDPLYVAPVQPPREKVAVIVPTIDWAAKIREN
jgi:hypothetical protein